MGLLCLRTCSTVTCLNKPRVLARMSPLFHWDCLGLYHCTSHYSPQRHSPQVHSPQGAWHKLLDWCTGEGHGTQDPESCNMISIPPFGAQCFPSRRVMLERLYKPCVQCPIHHGASRHVWSPGPIQQTRRRAQLWQFGMDPPVLPDHGHRGLRCDTRHAALGPYTLPIAGIPYVQL